MLDRENEVHKINEAFYRAFEGLDIEIMEKIWLRESYVQCIHPGWTLVAGWEAVMTSWREIFKNTQEIRFLLTEERIRVWGQLAWVTVYENITSQVEEETATAVVLATNIYERRPEGWFIVHHQGSPTVLPLTESDPTFH